MFTALLDACVLLPVALGDTLLRAAEQGLYRPVWSPRVLAEVREAFVKVHPHLAVQRIEYRLRAMERAFPDASVRVDEVLESGLELPDPKDRHVVAAALLAHADVIVTANLRDFPHDRLDPLGLAALAPDDFLLDQLDLLPPTMTAVVMAQAKATRQPPLAIEDVLIALGRAGAPRFAAEVLRLLPGHEHRSPGEAVQVRPKGQRGPTD